MLLYLAQFDAKNIFGPKIQFFFNFSEMLHNILKATCRLYVAQFDEKNTFLT